MREFCIRHGDGGKWYLNAANYAEELLRDARRARYIEEFIPEVTAPFVAGMERVVPEAALAQMAALEDEGAICNCAPTGCLAPNFTRRGPPLCFPGEGKASVEAARCTGCGACLELCQFSALSSGADRSAVVDAARCHGLSRFSGDGPRRGGRRQPSRR